MTGKVFGQKLQKTFPVTLESEDYGVLNSSTDLSPCAGHGIDPFIAKIGCTLRTISSFIGMGAGAIGGRLPYLVTMGCRITSIISSASSLLTELLPIDVSKILSVDNQSLLHPFH